MKIKLRQPSQPNPLYPFIDDPDFATKLISNQDYIDSTSPSETYDRSPEEVAERLDHAKFTVQPHQLISRYFLSFNSPYNGLLLYHGLGTGKTCSAIQLCEIMQSYYQEMAMTSRIYIVANKNIHNEFKHQLFDPSRLVWTGKEWMIDGCVASSILRKLNIQMNPDRSSVVRLAKNYIKENYRFVGYVKFMNYIHSVAKLTSLNDATSEVVAQRLNRRFRLSTIVIDEIHNIRYKHDGDKSLDSTSNILKTIMMLVKCVSTIKLLLMSATPMFNDAGEIITILNILRANDNLPLLKKNMIFDKNNTLQTVNGREIGKDILKSSVRGYVSFVQSNNPFAFPSRVYPIDFAPTRSTASDESKLDCYETPLTPYQEACYSSYIREHKLVTSSIVDHKSLVYMTNICYPSTDEFAHRPKKVMLQMKKTPDYMIGESGLLSVVNLVSNNPIKYKYNQSFDHFFRRENLSTYSAKLSTIIDCIASSEGIVMIYSQYINSGVIPIALALEELGLTRYLDSENLFTTPRPPVHFSGLHSASHLKEKHPGETFARATYTLMTGVNNLSKNQQQDLEVANSVDNKDGSRIKVIVISDAASEGVDLKNVRQVHVLDPWYNINRIEQIIGRSVRYRSHVALPFNKRNVEVYMHVSSHPSSIPVDKYMYSLCNDKIENIAAVTRAIKEASFDCALNQSMNHSFAADKLNMKVTCVTSSGRMIELPIGSKSGTLACDYVHCDYQCDAPLGQPSQLYSMENQSDALILTIIDAIVSLFRSRFYYSRADLIRILLDQRYKLTNIQSALDALVSFPYYTVRESFASASTICISPPTSLGHTIPPKNDAFRSTFTKRTLYPTTAKKYARIRKRSTCVFRRPP